MNMKSIIRRSIALLLAALLLLPLCGCAGDVTALSFGSAVVTKGMYTYWYSSYKNYYIYVFGGEDSDAYFDTAMQGAADGTTVGDYYDGQIAEVLASNVASLYLFDSLGLSLSATEKSDIQQTLNSEIENAGGRAALNEKLGKMGINLSTLEKVLEAEAKIAALYSYLFGDSSQDIAGKETITDTERAAFYEKNYVCVKQILIRTEEKNKVGEDGYALTDDEGNVLTEALTAEEKAAKQASVTAVEAALAAGTDFDTLMSQYNEDTSAGTYQSGYLVAAFSGFDTTFSNAALSLEMGETVRIETTAGVQFLKRVPLVSEPWNDSIYENMLNNFQSYLESEHFSALTADIVGQIRRNESAIADISVKTADISFWS